jgi:hypothetical protein
MDLLKLYIQACMESFQWRSAPLKALRKTGSGEVQLHTRSKLHILLQTAANNRAPIHRMWQDPDTVQKGAAKKTMLHLQDKANKWVFNAGLPPSE